MWRGCGCDGWVWGLHQGLKPGEGLFVPLLACCFCRGFGSFLMPA